MSNTSSNAAIVEELRLKTEQSDMSQYLKSSLGGYTKSSVHEYFSSLRKQQQAMCEIFQENQQVLFDEKEKLRKESETLKRCLDTALAEYNSLKSSIKLNELEDSDSKSSDLPAFKNKISVFEEELKKLGTEKSIVSSQLAQKSKALEDLNAKIEAFEEEKQAIREMLRAEIVESKNQRSVVARLNASIEERDAEIEALKAQLSESEIIKQNETIGRLNGLIEEQNELVSKYTEEKEANLKTIFALGDENEALRSNISRLNESIEELSRQNDKLSYTAKMLTEQLEAEYSKSLALIKEKSALSIEKMTVSRKLEEANSKIAILEQRLRRTLCDEPSEAPVVKSENLYVATSILTSTQSK